MVDNRIAKLFDVRYGRANPYQFIAVVAAIAATFWSVTTFSLFASFPPLYYVLLLVCAYIFTLFIVRRMRDMTGANSVDLPMIWDFKVLGGAVILPERFKKLALFFGDSFPYENRYGLPPKGLNFFTMVTEGYPLSEKEWAIRLTRDHKYTSKVRPGANELTEAPVRAERD